MRTVRFLFGASLMLIFAISVMVCVSGCGQSNAGMEKLKTTIRSAWVDEAWNKGNLSALDELFASDYVYHNIPFPDMNGLDAYKQFITNNRTGYPDIKITLEDVIVEGDKVVTWGTYQGTQQGLSPTMGITTGKPVNFRWCTVSHMANGKFVESWAYVDYLGLRQQIGYLMLPPATDKTFARVTVAQLKPGKMAGLLKFEKETAVPFMKSYKEFQGFCFLGDEKTGKICSISIWDGVDVFTAGMKDEKVQTFWKEFSEKTRDFFIVKPIGEGYAVKILE